MVREDPDWDKTVRWKQAVPEAGPEPAKEVRAADRPIGPARRVARPEPFQVTITWRTDAKTEPGRYRIVHYGRFKKGGKVERFVATSRPFSAPIPETLRPVAAMRAMISSCET